LCFENEYERKMMYYIGIDPGNNGCIAVVDDSGYVRHWLNLKDKTEHDIAQFLAEFDDGRAVIERVSSSPQMGVVSAFTFGRSYGFLRGLMVAMHIRFREVTPAVWQKRMGCKSGGDKNVTKAAAQKLWPSQKFTHANSDATLIAEYGRLTHQ